TFCKVPVCLNQEDLRAGKVDVAICGVPIDTSIGQRGAAHGPMAIRAAERYVPGPRRGGFPHQHVRIDPFEVLRVVAYGDEPVPARNFIQVGLRGYYPSDELFAWMQQKGMRSHYMAEVERKGFEAVMERAIAEALDGPELLYVSVDVDALDPAYAPGTGTP